MGPTAIAISYGDPVKLAKVLVDFAKANHEAFEIKGVFAGRQDSGLMPRSRPLASLPSLDGLRGMLVGLLNAPATKLVRLLSEPGAQLARLVSARKDALGEGSRELNCCNAADLQPCTVLAGARRRVSH